MLQWLKKVWNSLTGVRSSPQRRLNLRRWLAGDTPGLWASNHLEETTRCTGYSYVAVRALALQFAQANVVCDDPKTLRLLERPNPNQSGSVFRFQAGQQLPITGTAYIWIVRNGFGDPVELYCLPTGLTRPQPPSAEFPYGSYQVDPLNNFGGGNTSVDGWEPMSPAQTLLIQGAEIDARDVRAVRWPHPLYMNEGLSAFSAGAVTLDIAEQVAKARYHALRNYSSPGMLVKLGQNVTPEEQAQLEAEIHDRNSSPHNARRNLIVPDDCDVSFHDSATELEYLQSHGQARDDVLALHRTPPVAVGITEAGTYAAFFAAMMQWVELEVQPSLDLFAGELSAALGRPIELHARRIDDPEIEFRREESKRAVVDQHIRAGAITVNEYRAMYKLPPVSWGDQPIGVRHSDSLDKPGGIESDAPEPPDAQSTGLHDPGRSNMPQA